MKTDDHKRIVVSTKGQERILSLYIVFFGIFYKLHFGGLRFIKFRNFT